MSSVVIGTTMLMTGLASAGDGQGYTLVDDDYASAPIEVAAENVPAAQSAPTFFAEPANILQQPAASAQAIPLVNHNHSGKHRHPDGTVHDNHPPEKATMTPCECDSPDLPAEILNVRPYYAPAPVVTAPVYAPAPVVTVYTPAPVVTTPVEPQITIKEVPAPVIQAPPAPVIQAPPPPMSIEQACRDPRLRALVAGVEGTFNCCAFPGAQKIGSGFDFFKGNQAPQLQFSSPVGDTSARKLMKFEYDSCTSNIDYNDHRGGDDAAPAPSGGDKKDSNSFGKLHKPVKGFTHFAFVPSKNNIG